MQNLKRSTGNNIGSNRIMPKRISSSIFKNLNDPAGVIMQEVYCPECRTKRDINNSEEEVMKNGRRVLKGRCISCNTPIIKVLNQKLKRHAMAR